MDKFLPLKDELALVIEEKSQVLYTKLQALDIHALNIPRNCQEYYFKSHQNRLFFSIQTSAHLLYKAIKKTGKPVHEVVIMDYGAGIGSLFLLAKIIGCHKVIYNDHLQDWTSSAQKIAEALNLEIDLYITADISQTLKQLESQNLQLDLMVSRNVIEHIYHLKDFYVLFQQFQPKAILYSTTTANYPNPATYIQHIRLHKRWEKVYRPQRRMIILKAFPELEDFALNNLAKLSRGLAGNDILQFVKDYLKGIVNHDAKKLYTNTCDPITGVWVENLLPHAIHRQLLASAGYKPVLEAGFWDTHYKKNWKNKLTGILNLIISSSGTPGIILAPFIYISGLPKE